VKNIEIYHICAGKRHKKPPKAVELYVVGCKGSERVIEEIRLVKIQYIPQLKYQGKTPLNNKHALIQSRTEM
jgi:hypothetical protein